MKISATVTLEQVLKAHAEALHDVRYGKITWSQFWRDERRANLTDANLTGANLRGADLTRVRIDDTAPIADGVTLREFREQVVPALCVAGGQPLEVVAASWDCHTWENCPMHAAFGATSLDEVPALYRSQARVFVQLFDAGLLPKPVAA